VELVGQLFQPVKKVFENAPWVEVLLDAMLCPPGQLIQSYGEIGRRVVHAHCHDVALSFARGEGA